MAAGEEYVSLEQEVGRKAAAEIQRLTELLYALQRRVELLEAKGK